MSDMELLALVLLLVMLVIGLSLLRSYSRRAQAAKKSSTKTDAEKSALEALGRTRLPGSEELKVILSKNIDETRSSDLEQTAAAEKALSNFRNNGASKLS